QDFGDRPATRHATASAGAVPIRLRSRIRHSVSCAELQPVDVDGVRGDRGEVELDDVAHGGGRTLRRQGGKRGSGRRRIDRRSSQSWSSWRRNTPSALPNSTSASRLVSFLLSIWLRKVSACSLTSSVDAKPRSIRIVGTKPLGTSSTTWML